MPFAALSYGVAHYRDEGPRDALTMVFINSLGTDLRIWDGVVDRLAESYRQVTFDKRGHGLSSVPPAPYAISDFCGDLLELVDHLKLEKFVLVGVSVGGMIAQQFAIDHPHRLVALVLCDTAARIGDVAAWNGRIDTVRRHGMEEIADTVLLRWFPLAIRAGRQAEIEGWRNLLLRCPVEGYAGTCAALRDADLTESVATIAVPTLVAVGGEDQATPVELVRATAERIPAAQFVIIQNAGHIPSIDQPEMLATLIRDHVERHLDG